MSLLPFHICKDRHTLLERTLTFGVIGVLSSLSACSSAPQKLYYWNGLNYEEQIYTTLKNGSSPEKQLANLEEMEQQAASKDKKLPPGFYAHLGLLYAQIGRTDKAAAAFISEKTNFPEATPYMDFLLQNMKAPQATALPIEPQTQLQTPAQKATPKASSTLKESGHHV